MGIGRTAGRKAPPVTGHPVPEVPTLAEAASATKAPLGPEHDDEGANGVAPDHAFDLSYQDKRGYLWTGRFRCHVLTLKDRRQVGLVRARLAGGLPASALDTETSNLVEMQAHLAVALDEAPEWARDLDNIHDPGVLVAVYQEVAAHERRFHGAVD